MSLAAPFWLLLLIPWVAAVVYLMLGKPPRQAVPFLSLWRGPEAKRQVKPSISKLPAWIALLLLAAGVGIVAAARPGLMRPAPDDALRDRVGISAVAVRHNQVMVRLLNESSRREVPLALKWDAGERSGPVQLPEQGEQSYFLDIPSTNALRVWIPDATIEIKRRRTWPRVEARLPLPPALRRVLDVYAANRPAGDDSATVAMAADAATLGDQPGVILAGSTQQRSGRVGVIDHPVTRDTNWPGILAEPLVAAAPPAGFTPLLRVGEQVVLAVRDAPRQVWVGFDTPSFARTADYVVFWSNVFDFTGQGADVWEPVPGTVFASRSQIKPVQNRVQTLAPWLAMAAVALCAAGVVLAPRQVA